MSTEDRPATDRRKPRVFLIADMPVKQVGDTYRMAAIPGDTVTVGMHWFQPDHPAWPAAHSHPYDHLVFVLEGSMRFTLGDEALRATTLRPTE